MALTQFDLLFFVLEESLVTFGRHKQWTAWAQPQNARPWQCACYIFLEHDIAWKDASSNLDWHNLKIPARGTGPVIFLEGTIHALGAHFCLVGTCSDLGEGTDPKCPSVAPVLYSRLCNYIARSKNCRHSTVDVESLLDMVV